MQPWFLLLILGCILCNDIVPVKIGYNPTVVISELGEDAFFSITVPANISIKLSVTEVCVTECEHYETLVKLGSMPTKSDYDYSDFPVLLLEKKYERTFYGYSNITTNDTSATSILAQPLVQVFTNESTSLLRETLLKSKTLMVVIALQFVKRPDNIPSKAATAFSAFDHLYLPAYDSALFIKPYMRYYTFLTITSNMYFHTLEITPLATPYIIDYLNTDIKQESPFLHFFLDEIEDAISPNRSISGTFSLCNVDNTRLNHIYPPYYCISVKGDSDRLVSVNNVLIYMDVAYYLFQFVATGGILYYFLLMMRFIRKGSNFRFVTDSILNPPFWQCIFQLPTDHLANFRLWRAVQLSFIHIVTSILTLTAQLVPNRWPYRSNDTEIENFLPSPYFYVMIALVLVNSALFFSKLVRDYQHDRMLRVVLPKTIRYRIVRGIIAIVIALLMLPIMVLYLWAIFPTSAQDYRGYLWYTSSGIFTLGMMIHLYNKSTFVDPAINRLVNRKADEKFQKGLSVVYTILDNLHRASWITSQAMNIFTSVFVLIRVLQSSIANCIINNDAIATYGYIIAILIMFYRFVIDIETPYLKLKNLICKERGGYHWDRIVKMRGIAPLFSMEKVKKDLKLKKEVIYPIPMTWGVFVRISKLMRLTKMTARTILNMGFMMFVLCIFFLCSQTFTGGLFSKIGTSSTAIAILAGSILPVLPQVLGFIGATDNSVDSNVFLLRLQNSLRLLERKEERRNEKEFVCGSIPTRYLPFRYVTVSAWDESKREKMDELYKEETS